MTDANVVTVTQTVPVAARVNQGINAFRNFLRQPAVVRSMPMIVVAAVIAVGLLAITVLREPAYVVLFPQLEESDKATVLQTLTDKGIKAKLDGTTGQMTGPRADFYRAKMLWPRPVCRKRQVPVMTFSVKCLSAPAARLKPQS